MKTKILAISAIAGIGYIGVHAVNVGSDSLDLEKATTICQAIEQSKGSKKSCQVLPDTKTIKVTTNTKYLKMMCDGISKSANSYKINNQWFVVVTNTKDSESCEINQS